MYEIIITVTSILIITEIAPQDEIYISMSHDYFVYSNSLAGNTDAHKISSTYKYKTWIAHDHL